MRPMPRSLVRGLVRGQDQSGDEWQSFELTAATLQLDGEATDSIGYGDEEQGLSGGEISREPVAGRKLVLFSHDGDSLTVRISGNVEAEISARTLMIDGAPYTLDGAGFELSQAGMTDAVYTGDPLIDGVVYEVEFQAA